MCEESITQDKTVIHDIARGLIAPAVAGNVLWTLAQFILDPSLNDDHHISTLVLILGIGAYLVTHWAMFENEGGQNNWDPFANIVHNALIALIVMGSFYDVDWLPCLLVGFFVFNMAMHFKYQYKGGRPWGLIIVSGVGLIISGLAIFCEEYSYSIMATAIWVAFGLWIVVRKNNWLLNA